MVNEHERYEGWGEGGGDTKMAKAPVMKHQQQIYTSSLDEANECLEAPAANIPLEPR